MFATTAFAADPQKIVCATGLGISADGTTCSQVADGSSFVQIKTLATTVPAGGAFIIKSDSAPFAGAAPTGFTFSADMRTATANTDVAADLLFRITAPTVTGTTVVSAELVTYDANGTATSAPQGKVTVTWTAAATVDISATNSTVKLGSAAGCAAAKDTAKYDGSEVLFLCVTLKNGLNALTEGNVSVSIQPVGLVSNGGAYAQAVNKDTAAGYAEFWVKGSGLTGIGTVTISAVRGEGNPVSLGTKTVTFSGNLATLAIAGGASQASAAWAMASVEVTGKDKDGNAVDTVPAFYAVADGTTTAVLLTSAGPDEDGYFDIKCPTVTTATKYAVYGQVGTIKSNNIDLYCGVGTTPDKVEVKANTTGVASGSTTPLAVLATKKGMPIQDGQTPVIVVAAGGYSAPSKTSLGISNFAYVAPNTQGPVTVWAFFGSVGGSLTLNVGTGSALVITNANKLNLPTAAPSTYTTATEVASFGQYVTWRGFAGTGLANETIGVEVAAKNADGTWGAFTRLTSRLADANGVVLFSWRESSAKWLSVRFVGPKGNTSNAVQARWR